MNGYPAAICRLFRFQVQVLWPNGCISQTARRSVPATLPGFAPRSGRHTMPRGATRVPFKEAVAVIPKVPPHSGRCQFAGRCSKPNSPARAIGHCVHGGLSPSAGKVRKMNSPRACALGHRNERGLSVCAVSSSLGGRRQGRHLAGLPRCRGGMFERSRPSMRP